MTRLDFFYKISNEITFISAEEKTEIKKYLLITDDFYDIADKILYLLDNDNLNYKNFMSVIRIFDNNFKN